MTNGDVAKLERRRCAEFLNVGQTEGRKYFFIFLTRP